MTGDTMKMGTSDNTDMAQVVYGEQYIALETFVRAKNFLKQFVQRAEEPFVWVQEVLVEAKKTMSTPEVQLLPKTPSAKRARKQLRRRTEEDEETVEEELPKKSKTRGRPKKGRKAKGSDAAEQSMDDETEDSMNRSTRNGSKNRSTRNTRNTRSTRNTRQAAADQTDGTPTTMPPTRLSFTSVPNTIPEEAPAVTPEPEKKTDIKEQVEVCPDSEEEVAVTPKKKPLPTSCHKPASVHSPSVVQSPRSSPRSPFVKSPRAIPGFSNLSHVKQKVSAYESFARQSNSMCESHPEISNKKSTPASTSVTEIPATPEAGESEQHVPMETVSESPDAESRCSSRRSHPRQSKGGRKSGRKSDRERRLSRLSGVYKGTAKKRSSAYRLLRQSIERSCRDVAVTNAAPVKQEPVSVSSAEASAESSGTEQPRRTTRSKLRANKPAPPKLPVSSESDGEESVAVAEPPRKTRSKMRVQKEPPKLPAPDSEEGSQGTASMQSSADDEATPSTPVQPQRTTRSKMRQKPALPKLPAPSSDEDTPLEEPPSIMAPTRSTRSKMRHWVKQAVESDSPYTSMRNSPRRSLKRAKDSSSESECATPNKRVRGVSRAESQADLSSRNTSILNSSRFTPGGARISVSGKTFLTSVKKHPVPTSNLNTVVSSFINRNTPKKVTAKDREEMKRKDMEAKQKHAEDRIRKKQEERHRKAEEMRRKHLERQQQVAARREERNRLDQQQRRNVQRKVEESKNLTAKMLDEKIKEERERQKHDREKKMQEAEAKRRQEEEARMEKRREKEREQREQEEMLARKREQEEAERQRRQAEQWRLEEERRLQAEREKAQEAERLRQEEELRLKQEAEERRLREERERKEREARERQEREKQAERERQRQEELRRQRDAELAKVREAAALEKARAEEEKRAREAIRKHNISLQQSANTSKVMNTTINLETGSAVLKENKPQHVDRSQNDSYQMTPQKKPVKKRINSYNNYDINEIQSGDSTDEEDQPRKRIPNWAQGAALKVAVINQNYHPPDLDVVFMGCFASLDLNVMFKQHRPRFNKRTSSAHWTSPMMKPSGKPLYH